MVFQTRENFVILKECNMMVLQSKGNDPSNGNVYDHDGPFVIEKLTGDGSLQKEDRSQTTSKLLESGKVQKNDGPSTICEMPMKGPLGK